MFTGLVQAMGRVRGVTRSDSGVRLRIDPEQWDRRWRPGDSISISGCCLTATGDGESLAFDVIAETLSKTTLGALAEGSRVNLESSLMASDLMGGHIVQGHVDGVGVVESVRTGADWRVAVRPPAALMEYMVPKGSVCLDGVSLTLAAVDPKAGTIEVALIPETLQRTTLASLKPGDRCNIEADVLAKTIVHWMKNYANR